MRNKKMMIKRIRNVVLLCSMLFAVFVGLIACGSEVGENEAKERKTTEEVTEITTEATTAAMTEEVTTEKATEEPAKTSDETVTIVVESGMYSEEVAERLMEAGIIDDAYDFNIWLESTGYATALEVGEFQVKKGMSYEEIAQVLTRAY